MVRREKTVEKTEFFRLCQKVDHEQENRQNRDRGALLYLQFQTCCWPVRFGDTQTLACRKSSWMSSSRKIPSKQEKRKPYTILAISNDLSFQSWKFWNRTTIIAVIVLYAGKSAETLKRASCRVCGYQGNVPLGYILLKLSLHWLFSYETFVRLFCDLSSFFSSASCSPKRSRYCRP